MRYNVLSLTLEQKTTICYKLKSICSKWWVDELDCSKSFARQTIEMSFDEIMSKLTSQSHFTIIERDIETKSSYIEVSFRTMDSSIDYFLYIMIEFDKSEIVKSMVETI